MWNEVQQYTIVCPRQTYKNYSNLRKYAISNKGRSPYNGRLSDFSFYIDSQISVDRKFKN